MNQRIETYMEYFKVVFDTKNYVSVIFKSNMTEFVLPIENQSLTHFVLL